MARSCNVVPNGEPEDRLLNELLTNRRDDRCRDRRRAIYLRTYAHLYPGDLRPAADAMDSARLRFSSRTMRSTSSGSSNHSSS